MEETDLEKLLRGSARPFRRRGWRCPSESKVAAYVDRRLDASTRENIEAHLADCDSCLEQVSFLARAAGWEEPVAVAPQVLARARKLVTSKQRSSAIFGWRWAATAAACLILAFAVFLMIRSGGQQTANETVPVVQHAGSPTQKSETPPDRNPDLVAVKPAQASRNSAPINASPAPEIRKPEPESNTPGLVFPRDGATIKRDDLEFRWQAVPDTVFYEVSVVTGSGDVVTARQTEATNLKLVMNSLTPGTKYFVSVRAHHRDGKTARSAIVSFRVVD